MAEEFRGFFSDAYQRRCAQFVEQHDNWSAALKAGHVFTGVFEAIATQPEKLLLDVMGFLCVRSEQRYIVSTVRNPLNSTESTRLPDAHRRYLEELLGDDLRKLRERFGLSW